MAADKDNGSMARREGPTKGPGTAPHNAPGPASHEAAGDEQEAERGEADARRWRYRGSPAPSVSAATPARASHRPAGTGPRTRTSFVGCHAAVPGRVALRDAIAFIIHLRFGQPPRGQPPRRRAPKRARVVLP